MRALRRVSEIDMENVKKQNLLAPIIVLVAICFVASALLAGAYQLTAPVIAVRQEEEANAAREAVLPGVEKFTLYEGELVQGVQDAYVAEGKDGPAGIVCQTSFNGFKGAVKLMIGLDAEGKVTGIQVMEHEETPGVGSNALTDEYLGQFARQTGADGIDAYSGATFTSKAVKNGVNAAAAQYKAVFGK